MRPVSNASESPDGNAAWEIACRLSDLSEECWAASWLSDCEHEIWEALTNPSYRQRPWPFVPLLDHELEPLRALSERCGGWIRWEEGIGPSFVSRALWLDIHARWMESRRVEESADATLQPSIASETRPCENCVAGGDSEPKLCERREDTGIPNDGAWLCEDCYQDWREQP